MSFVIEKLLNQKMSDNLTISYLKVIEMCYLGTCILDLICQPFKLFKLIANMNVQTFCNYLNIDWIIRPPKISSRCDMNWCWIWWWGGSEGHSARSNEKKRFNWKSNFCGWKISNRFSPKIFYFCGWKISTQFSPMIFYFGGWKISNRFSPKIFYFCRWKISTQFSPMIFSSSID